MSRSRSALHVALACAAISAAIGCGGAHRRARSTAPHEEDGPSVEAGDFKGPPRVMLTNGGDALVNLEIAGPANAKLSIAPGDTAAFEALPGTYSFTISDPLHQHEPLVTQGIELANDHLYQWTIGGGGDDKP